jgi:hypothetical protein
MMYTSQNYMQNHREEIRRVDKKFPEFFDDGLVHHACVPPGESVTGILHASSCRCCMMQFGGSDGDNTALSHSPLVVQQFLTG